MLRAVSQLVCRLRERRRERLVEEYESATPQERRYAEDVARAPTARGPRVEPPHPPHSERREPWE